MLFNPALPDGPIRAFPGEHDAERRHPWTQAQA
jgi:hypothetical protein